MGESSPALCPDFNRSFRISASPALLTNQAGAALLRAVLDRIGLVDAICPRISDDRDPDLITHSVSELLRTRLLLGALGHSTISAADSLRFDPVLRAAVSDHRGLSPFQVLPQGQPVPRNPKVPLGLASQPTLSRDTTNLSSENHRELLREGMAHISLHNLKRFVTSRIIRLLIDIDSLPMVVSGEQEQSEYNGHYHARIFHPLVAFVAETGDLVDLQLRPGKVHTAKGVRAFIDGLLRRFRRAGYAVELYLRFDAGFPGERLLRKLEKTGVKYLARIRHQEALDGLAGPFLAQCEAARHGQEQLWAFEARYQAKSWRTERRVVVVFQDLAEEQGRLNWFWLITNLTEAERSAPELVQEYRQRGTTEAHLGEWNAVVRNQLSSTNRPKSTYGGEAVKQREEPIHAFEQNETQALLNALVYGLLNTTRLYQEAQQRRAAKEKGQRASGMVLRRLVEETLRAPGRVVRHARRAWLKVSEEVAAQFQALGAEMVRSK